MKIFLIVFIFLIFLSIGVWIYCKYYYRHQLFKDLCYVCSHLKNNITFRKDKISIILNESYSNISSNSKKLFLNISKSSNFIFKNEDIELVRKFMNSLGKGDVDYEINNLNYYENNFNELRVNYHELLKKNGTMYIKLMIGIGLAVCVILI